MKPTLTCFLTVLLAATNARAELRLASIFADHAILQRDRPVPVWGRAEPGETIAVEFAGQKKTATADASGRWRVTLDAMPASAEPRELHVQSKIQSAWGGRKSKIVDVLVGDVWLIAGGSEVGKRAADLEPAANVRVFEVAPGSAREAQPNVKGRWSAVTAASVKGLSAEAVLIGRALATELGVPVGIVTASIGYPVESWMSRESLAATPEAAPILAYYASDAWKMRTVGTFEERLKAWTEYCQKLPLNPRPKPKPDDVDTLPKQEPAGAWNAMIAP
ncbi:MAG: hypothetical protein FJ279_36195, partial [Planctomycetes bacterium]|nr:hypothetical protein [Planctomycetota bacterium]